MVSVRDENGKLNTYGEIFIGDKFKDLTICIFDDQIGWNNKSGFIVSAPAESRKEALEISNRLMKKFLMNKLE